MHILTSLENLFERFFEDPNWWVKCCIGGVLSFIPVLNIFAFGYLYQCSFRVYAKNPLPEWKNIRQLLYDGLVFLGLGSIFMGGFLLLGWLVSQFLLMVSFGLLGIIAYIPLSLTLLAAPGVFMMALFKYQKYRSWRLLLDVKGLWMPLCYVWPKSIVGGIFFWGLFFVFLPVYGFALFVGCIFLIYYFSNILKISEETL